MSTQADPRYKGLNKEVITKRAKEEMINVHSQKYIKAWIDTVQFKEKIEILEADWDLISPEAQARVDAFVDKRLATPEGQMVPDGDIAHAVATRLGLDTVTQSYKNACAEFKFFEDVVKLIQGLKI